jgi:hypothetical protein
MSKLSEIESWIQQGVGLSDHDSRYLLGLVKALRTWLTEMQEDRDTMLNRCYHAEEARTLLAKLNEK